MAYYITPDLGLALADPNTVQAFETVNVNGNFELLIAAIVADRARLTDLEAGVQSYNPTWTGVTLTSASVTGRYLKVGKLLLWRARIITGVAAAITGDVFVTMPFTIDNSGLSSLLSYVGGGAVRKTSGGASYPVYPRHDTSSRVQLLITGSAYSNLQNISATQPFSPWSSGDGIDVWGLAVLP